MSENVHFDVVRYIRSSPDRSWRSAISAKIGIDDATTEAWNIEPTIVTWLAIANTPTCLAELSAPRKRVWRLPPKVETMFEKYTGPEWFAAGAARGGRPAPRTDGARRRTMTAITAVATSAASADAATAQPA